METVFVRDEEQAFQLLERALKGDMSDLQGKELSFENWPVITIRVTGEGYDSTVTAEIAEAIVVLQQSINRTYARVLHDSGNARTLKEVERADLAIRAKVQSGSSIVQVDLSDVLKEAVLSVVKKMGPEEAVITILSIAAIYGSVTVIKHWLNKKSEDKAIEARSRESVALSQEETKRMQVMADVVQSRPLISGVRSDGEEAHRAILKSAEGGQTITVQGIHLEAEDARKISASPRTQSRPVQLNGNYRIRKIDWQQPEEVKIWLTNVDSSFEFMASLNTDGWSSGHLAILQSAEWERKAIQMSINAFELRGEVTSAHIVGVSLPEN